MEGGRGSVVVRGAPSTSLLEKEEEPAFGTRVSVLKILGLAPVDVPGLVTVTLVAEGGVEAGDVVATDEVALVVVGIVVKVVARVVEVPGEGGDEGDDGVCTEKKLTLEGLVVEERRVELAVSLS